MSLGLATESGGLKERGRGELMDTGRDKETSRDRHDKSWRFFCSKPASSFCCFQAAEQRLLLPGASVREAAGRGGGETAPGASSSLSSKLLGSGR